MDQNQTRERKREMSDLKEKANRDLDRYAKLMSQPHGWSGCLRIEEDWALAGYSPEIVTSILHRVSEGEAFDKAESAVLSKYE
jgi:hypothetical protein